MDDLAGPRKETDDLKLLLVEDSGVSLILVLAQMVRFCLKTGIATMRRCRVPVYVMSYSHYLGPTIGLQKI